MAAIDLVVSGPGEFYLPVRPDLLDVLLLEPGGSNFSAFGGPAGQASGEKLN